MSVSTPRCALPLLDPAQAQKSLTMNETLLRLDALLTGEAVSATMTLPPESPVDGDLYLVPEEPGGAWMDQAGKLAMRLTGSWRFADAPLGFHLRIRDSGAVMARTATGWHAAPNLTGTLENLDRLAINSSADANNRLAARLNGCVFTAEPTAEGGDDNVRLYLSKSAEAATASLIFQDENEGVAELGLAGDNDLQIKISADGNIWSEALRINRSSARVEMPMTAGLELRPNLAINPVFTVNQRGFAGGTLAGDVYGYDRWKARPGGAVASRQNAAAHLTSGTLIQTIEGQAFGIEGFDGEIVQVRFRELFGEVTVTIGAMSATLGGSDVDHASFVIPSGTALSTLDVALTGNNASWRDLKIETAPQPTAMLSRSFCEEELLCKRYYWELAGPIHLFLYAIGSANYFFNSMALPATMRTTPTCSRTISASGNLFENDVANATFSGLSPKSVRLSLRSGAAGECYAVFEQLIADAEF